MKLQRATFVNRLHLKEDVRTAKQRIYFQHSYRCPVQAWFEESDKNSFGWVVQFETSSDHILKNFRNDIFKTAVSYIEKRAKKRAVDIKFYQIALLATAKEVKSAEFHVYKEGRS